MGVRSLITAGLFGTCLAAAGDAAAQVAGEYLGNNSDGYQVTLGVYQNAKGKLFLTLVRDVAFFYCDGKLLLTRGTSVPYGVSVVMEAPIENGTATFAGRSNDLGALTGTVTFAGDTVSGKLVGYAALFSGTKTPPNDAEAKSCRTHDLRFAAKLAGPL